MAEQVKTLNFVDEARLERYDQIYWNPSQSYPAGHFDASLSAFDQVRVLARTRTGSQLPPASNRLPAKVSVGEFPYYIGAAAAARSSPDLIRTAHYWADREQYLVLRGPGVLSVLVWYWLRQAHKNYAVEVLGDPREVFRVVKHPLSRVWRILFSTTSTQIIRHASAVLYVSGRLQTGYPPGRSAPRYVASDVRLQPQAYSAPRVYEDAPRPLRIANVGNMEQVYKGHDYLLQAMAICSQRGFPIEAHLVGEGRLRPQFERQARELGIADAVKFHGTVPWGPEIFGVLDAVDMFVQCSLTEGLPKALVEAMARGLPAIGTQVGGIPDLLTPDALVQPADAGELAGRLMALGSNASALTHLSHANFERSLEFRLEILEEKRRAFYQEVRRVLSAG